MMEFGKITRFDLPNKDSGGSTEEHERLNEELFTTMMGGPDSEFIRARDELLNTQAAGIELSKKQIIDSLGEDYPKIFREAVHAKGLKTGSPEWIELTDSLRAWCLLEDNESKEEEKESKDRTVVDDKKDNTTRRKKAPPDIEAKIEEINKYTDPIFRRRAFTHLAQQAHSAGFPADVINRITQLSVESRSTGDDEFSKLPRENDISGWVDWYRNKLKEYLDPSKEMSLRETRGNRPFMVEQIQITGKMLVDASPMIPEALKKNVEEELRTVTELRAMFFKWEKNHSNLKAMANEENEDFPSNDLMNRVLNNLNGVVENGERKELIEGEGSKNVSKAIMMYWRMAEMLRKTKSKLESVSGAGDGLDVEVPSIFNTLLSDKEVSQIRKEIADKCGGEYYETLGLILSKFMGLAARGSDSALPGISDADCMGRLIFSRLWNYWKDEEQRKDKDERADRWLPDEMSNAFLEIDEMTGEFKKKDGKMFQIRVGLDCTTMQTKGEIGKRGYYLVDIGEEKYKIVKKVKRDTDIEGDVDSGVLFRSLVEKGELNKIDWEANSLDLLFTLKRRNQKSLAVSTMLKEPVLSDSSLEPSVYALTTKADLIDSALDHYGRKTKQWVGYLYLESWLRRHSSAFLRAEHGINADISKKLWSNDLMKQYIDNGERSGLISKEGAKKLKVQYRIGIFRL